MTTLNLQVGAGADDGSIGVNGTPVYNNDDAYTYVGATFGDRNLEAWWRFTGVSGLSGSTIDSASISLYGYGSDRGTPLTKIFADDQASPTAPTSQPDFSGRTRTTAGVDWDSPGLSTSAFTESPSIVSVIQELADSYDPGVIQILHDDDGSSHGETNAIKPWCYEGATAKAAKLDIDYTVVEPFVTGAAVLSGIGSMAVVAAITRAAEVALSGVGSMVAGAAITLPAKVAMSGVGTMVVAGTKGTTQFGAAVLSGVGTLAAAGVITASGKAVLSGIGSMAVAGRRISTGVAVMSGVGSMSVIGEVAGLLEGRAVLSGVGSMSVIGERIVGGKASFSGVGSMTTAGVSTLGGKVAMSGVGSMTVIGETGVVLFTIFGGVLRSIDPADYPSGAQFFLEVTLDAGSGTARARLYNITDAAAVADSDLSTASPTPVRLRSAALTLPSAAKTYRVEYGGAIDGTYTIYAADLLVESD